MNNEKLEFLLNPEDERLNVLRTANNMIKKILGDGVKLRLVVSKWKPVKTPAQHRTIWMWDGEVAAQLNIMGAMSGATVKWSSADVHDMIFKKLCMPMLERQLPGGEILSRPMGLSDNPSREIVSEAMERYQCWAAEYGIGLTQPSDMDLMRYEEARR